MLCLTLTYTWWEAAVGCLERFVYWMYGSHGRCEKVASCDARGPRQKGGQLDLEGGAAKPRETDPDLIPASIIEGPDAGRGVTACMFAATHNQTPPWPSLYDPLIEFYHLEHHAPTQPGGRYLTHGGGMLSVLPPDD
jgi:hypothetical protein